MNGDIELTARHQVVRPWQPGPHRDPNKSQLQRFPIISGTTGSTLSSDLAPACLWVVPDSCMLTQFPRLALLL